MIIGNLGADPEVRSTNNGSRVATLSVATSRQWNSQSGEKQEKTEWHRVICWNNKGSGLADVAEKYLKKGDKVYIEGRGEYRTWEDREKQKRYRTQIIARELIMLSPKGGGGGGGGGRGGAVGGARRPGPGAPPRPPGGGRRGAIPSRGCPATRGPPIRPRYSSSLRRRSRSASPTKRCSIAVAPPHSASRTCCGRISTSRTGRCGRASSTPPGSSRRTSACPGARSSA